MEDDIINVIAAVIRQNGKLLICQRAFEKRYGGLWEFPGGKLKPKESFLDAATRELKEELGIQVLSMGDLLYSNNDPGSSFVIHFFEVEIQGTPIPIEHNAIQWVSLTNLFDYELAINDRKFVETIVKEKGGKDV